MHNTNNEKDLEFFMWSKNTHIFACDFGTASPLNITKQQLYFSFPCIKTYIFIYVT